MSSASTRPTKRVRLEADSNFNLSYQFDTLVQRLSVLDDNTFETVLSEIISTLGDPNLSNVSTRKLHKLLVLYMGFFMPSSARREAKFQNITLVTSCLKSLYQSKAFRKGDTNLEFEEANEVFSLALQLLKRLSPPLKVGCIEKTAKNCFVLLEVSLQNHNLRESLEIDRSRLEDLFVTTLKSNNDLESPNPLRMQNFYFIFKEASSRRLARIAQLASDGEWFDCENEDLAFFLTCLPFSSKSRLWSEKIRASFNRLLEKKNLGLEPVVCFGLLVVKWGLPDDCLQSFDVALDIMMRKAYLNQTHMAMALSCLQRLTIRKSLLSLLYKQKVLHFLTASAVEYQNNGLAEKAGEILLEIASIAKKSAMATEKGSKVLEVIQMVSAMLISESPRVVQKAVLFLRDCFHDTSLEAFKIEWPDDVITALAEVSLNEFTPKPTQRHVMQIFQNLIAMDSLTYTNFLTREPKVLESIVHAASDQGTRKTRELATTIIFEMSKHVCNHRVLATQKGLLTSMIWYTRNLSRSGREYTNVCASLKKQILIMARTL